eukprot:scaffold12131_cov124-Skeletonema_dohrnii-CCMP3373.AAC.3
MPSHTLAVIRPPSAFSSSFPSAAWMANVINSIASSSIGLSSSAMAVALTSYVEVPPLIYPSSDIT